MYLYYLVLFPMFIWYSIPILLLQFLCWTCNWIISCKWNVFFSSGISTQLLIRLNDECSIYIQKIANKAKKTSMCNISTSIFNTLLQLRRNFLLVTRSLLLFTRYSLLFFFYSLLFFFKTNSMTSETCLWFFTPSQNFGFCFCYFHRESSRNQVPIKAFYTI